MGKKRGKLIVFEGIDGSGKATQAKLLFKYLRKQKIPAEFISFPIYTSNWGKMVRRYLDGEFGGINHVDPYLASVLYAGDRLLVSEQIKNWIRAGEIVVCDRYTGSNIAHQAAKVSSQSQREKFIAWIENFEYKGNKIPRENLVILLSIPVSKSQTLMKYRKRDIHERDRNYLVSVVEVFEDLAKKKDYWKTVECMENGRLLKPKEIHKRVLDLLAYSRVAPLKDCCSNLKWLVR